MDQIANMNLTAFVVGIIIAVVVIIRFRKTKLERKVWVYPLLIATFPVYYWVFAIYGSDMSALYKEVLVGIVFIGLAFLAIKINRKTGLVLLSAACILHGVYDVGHDRIFINSGTPTWWPEFCGAIDILIGIYLLYLAINFRTAHKEQAQSIT